MLLFCQQPPAWHHGQDPANYDLIIIDTPAGLEHFSRKTIPDLDDTSWITDESRRGLTTAERIRDTAREIELKYQNLYVIVNKVTPGGGRRCSRPPRASA